MPSTASIKSKKVKGSIESSSPGSGQDIQDPARFKKTRESSKRQNDVPPLFIVREEEEMDATPLQTGTRANVSPDHPDYPRKSRLGKTNEDEVNIDQKDLKKMMKDIKKEILGKYGVDSYEDVHQGLTEIQKTGKVEKNLKMIMDQGHSTEDIEEFRMFYSLLWYFYYYDKEKYAAIYNTYEKNYTKLLLKGMGFDYDELFAGPPLPQGPPVRGSMMPMREYMSAPGSRLGVPEPQGSMATRMSMAPRESMIAYLRESENVRITGLEKIETSSIENTPMPAPIKSPPSVRFQDRLTMLSGRGPSSGLVSDSQSLRRHALDNPSYDNYQPSYSPGLDDQSPSKDSRLGSGFDQDASNRTIVIKGRQGIGRNASFTKQV